MTPLRCFKAYDIRGRVPEELNEPIAESIGRALVEVLRGKRFVVGRDIRLSSPALSAALIEGIRAAGATVCDIGRCGTEEVYFATHHLNLDGGVMVTASHNPMDYNGMKFVGRGAKPISGDKGLREIRCLAEKGVFHQATKRGGIENKADVRWDYVQHLLGYLGERNLSPLKIVVNPGNGGAGDVIDHLQEKLPFELVKVNYPPDGTFPNGVPNPLLPDNRESTRNAVVEHKADMGLAWDGDFDRCFFFDEQGRFIEGYYVVGLLADAILRRRPGENIIHDPRLTWNTLDIVHRAGGVPVQSKTGHAFIKQRMRLENAVYGGEMSGHHYFREFAYCDSGMIPWLLVTELMSARQQSLSALVSERMAKFPCSGEINFKVPSSEAVIGRLRDKWRHDAVGIDETDGLSVEFKQWRFNVRGSNTEPLLRLNVEARGDADLVRDMTQLLSGQVVEAGN